LNRNAIRTIGTLLVALMGLYLGCFVYRLATHGAFYAAFIAMITLHLFGIESSIFQALVAGMDVARSSDVAMYATGAAAFGAAMLLTPRQLDLMLAQKPGGHLVAAVALVFAAAISADLYYGITPLSEINLREPRYNAQNARIEHRLSVENIMHLPDRLSGVRAEVEGTLTYEPRMKRFELASAANNGFSVQVFFFKGRRTAFSEIRTDGKPRYYEMVAGLIGRKVKIIGTCVNGQIDADVANVQEIADFTNGGGAERPLAPI
jgi:hypothetical protein